MSNTVGIGLFGSIRRRVTKELREHARQNLAMQRASYSTLQRLARSLIGGRTLSWFLGWYTVLAFLIVFAELAANRWLPVLLLGWTAKGTKDIIREIGGFFIAGQVGLLAIVSVAVGVVTLISQRDDKSSTNTDVRLYYSESFAYEVVASGSALLLILCAQLFWPLQHVLHAVDFGGADLTFKLALTAVHAHGSV